MSTHRVLDQVEVAIRNSLHIPLTGLAVIDGDRVLSILERVRNTLPEELKQARYLTQENQRIIREAQEKADAILAEAEEEAARRVAESEILKVAREQAEELTRRAKRTAREMREEAEAYARDVLAGLECELDRLASIVRNGKSKLERTPEEAEAETRVATLTEIAV